MWFIMGLCKFLWYIIKDTLKNTATCNFSPLCSTVNSFGPQYLIRIYYWLLTRIFAKPHEKSHKIMDQKPKSCERSSSTPNQNSFGNSLPRAMREEYDLGLSFFITLTSPPGQPNRQLPCSMAVFFRVGGWLEHDTSD